jgi:GntR family transcriptional regulator
VAEISDAIFIDIAVDHEKPVAYHTQVYEALEKLITTKRLRAGDQLPGEPKLCQIFGVSRPVIRQALDQLMRDGLVTRVMGKGTFVTEPKIREGLVGSLTGFHEDMIRQGYTPVSRTLKQALIPATEKIAAHLRLPVGTEVIELRRLRFVNNSPIQLLSTYLPATLCPIVLHADFTYQSLYALLRTECGVTIASGKRSIEAVLANKEEARLLEIPLGAPLILLDSVTYDDSGRAIEYYHAVHRSDRARFEVDLVRTNT